MKVSKKILPLIEAKKMELESMGVAVPPPEPWEEDDDGLMYLSSLTELAEEFREE